MFYYSVDTKQYERKITMFSKKTTFPLYFIRSTTNIFYNPIQIPSIMTKQKLLRLLA